MASGRNKKKAVRIKGIVRDAEALGVSRVHLYLVLRGKRTSRRLLHRYIQLGGAER